MAVLVLGYALLIISVVNIQGCYFIRKPHLQFQSTAHRLHTEKKLRGLASYVSSNLLKSIDNKTDRK